VRVTPDALLPASPAAPYRFSIPSGSKPGFLYPPFFCAHLSSCSSILTDSRNSLRDATAFAKLPSLYHSTSKLLLPLKNLWPLITVRSFGKRRPRLPTPNRKHVAKQVSESHRSRTNKQHRRIPHLHKKTPTPSQRSLARISRTARTVSPKANTILQT